MDPRWCIKTKCRLSLSCWNKQSLPCRIILSGWQHLNPTFSLGTITNVRVTHVMCKNVQFFLRYSSDSLKGDFQLFSAIHWKQTGLSFSSAKTYNIQEVPKQFLSVLLKHKMIFFFFFLLFSFANRVMLTVNSDF